MDIKEYENYHETKEHARQEFAYNTYLCSMPLDFLEVPLHWHDEMEIIYIKKGKGLVSVEFEEQRVQGGEFVIVLPGQLHGIRSLSGEQMEYENIMFRPEILYGKQEDGTKQKYFEPLFRMQRTIPSFYREGVRGYEAIKKCLDECDQICMVCAHGYELLVKSQLYVLIYYVCEISDSSEGTKSRVPHEEMKRVLKYVELHYMEKLTIEDMANVSGFSSSHFMKYFKNNMGQSFIDYLNDYRLTMASRMLLASTDAVLMVAQEAGFDNMSYFNRIFKRKFGLTPREYRKYSESRVL